MRKFGMVILCGLSLLAAACQQQKEPAASKTSVLPGDVRNAKVSEVIQPLPQFIDRARLGSKLGPDGLVSAETDSIPAGDPIYLTMFLRESPSGLQTSAVWTTIDKKPLKTEHKVMNGAKTVTFGLNNPKMKPGHYRVVGYWGGNIATERQFQIVAKSKRKKG